MSSKPKNGECGLFVSTSGYAFPLADPVPAAPPNHEFVLAVLNLPILRDCFLSTAFPQRFPEAEAAEAERQSLFRISYTSHAFPQRSPEH
jgi:hypothetical protein